MKRTMMIALVVGFALTALQAAPASAGCGNGIKETGEQCDHGSTNGITCCDTTCHWVDAGAGCIPSAPGYDSCHQGTCGGGTSHTCNATSPPVNPCVGVACRDCVSTGPQTLNFTCTGDPFSTDTVCVGDSNPCTIEHCGATGSCDGDTTAKCPEPANSCKVATCNTGTGTCGTNNRSNGINCNDGNSCTVSEQCSSGNCTAGIVNVSAGTACDNDIDCRSGETCNGAGSCLGGTLAAPGTACDDWNDCRDNTTCSAIGQCIGGTVNAEGTPCIAVEPGDGLGGNTCRKVGTCQGGFCVAPEKLENEGADCTNGDPCNTGFCSGGECIRRDPTQQSGTVNDWNSCTDPSSTTCNTAGHVSTPTCVVGTCDQCGFGCSDSPGLEVGGSAAPCSCTYTK